MARSGSVDGVRWFLFDAVGTLMFAEPAVAEIYADTGRRFGSRLSAAEIERRFLAALAAERAGEALARPPTGDEGERARWRRIVGAVIDDVQDCESVFDAMWRHFGRPKSWQVFDDVAPTLDTLPGLGFRWGIASNFDSRLGEVVAGQPALARCEAVFVSSELGYSKPEARFFAAVERQLGVGPEEILMVGDDWLNDVVGAQACGWKAVHLDRCGNGKTPAAIRSLRELPSAGW